MGDGKPTTWRWKWMARLDAWRRRPESSTSDWTIRYERASGRWAVVTKYVPRGAVSS